jgi:hypothetical protein
MGMSDHDMPRLSSRALVGLQFSGFGNWGALTGLGVGRAPCPRRHFPLRGKTRHACRTQHPAQSEPPNSQNH